MQPTYPFETAESLFTSLKNALSTSPLSYNHIYYTLDQVFRLVLDQQTSALRTNFVGPYAKLDYLLKEHRADETLRRHINTTRVRLGNLRSQSRINLVKPSDNPTGPNGTASQLRSHYAEDLAHICHFIALVFSTSIPEELSVLFPAEGEAEAPPLTSTSLSGGLLADSLRAIVTIWNETFITCRVDGYACSSEVRLRYSYPANPGTSGRHHNDFSYLAEMLHENCQLNLVRPREEENYLTAEFIIFEPDYLVDISTVARCFESYAESPYVNLVKKLQSSANSEAVVLGNFAGQLLDEELHDLPDDYTYAKSVGEFFRSNAIRLLTTELSKDFHENARKQKRNIEAAIRQQLPSLVTRFDPRECIVEPSFVCETLGLQGRMDMLQMDFRVLLEQKSGKGGYPQGDFVRPTHTEQHYVQLLLYMAVLRYGFHDVYMANDRELHAFLLYSRYTESLLGLGFAPSLLLRALQIRNGIACTELQFIKPNKLRLLERITPDSLNMKKSRGVLWERYVRPQLDALLAPIHSASPLERDYYFRFLTFITGEHVLSKLGNKTKENSGFASVWHNTLDEKLQAGNIYHNLRFDASSLPVEGSVERVSFAFDAHSSVESSNFRVGDIVALYPYVQETVPDMRRAIVFRGSIALISPTHITIELRAPQTSSRVFSYWNSSVWAVEHDFIESTYTALYRSMHSLLLAPKERRDLILLQRHPQTTKGRALVGDYGAFNSLAQRVKEADELFLIIGPPGTGKTSFGMLNTLREALTDPEASVLVLSFTNRAVDEICSKLVESQISFIRLGRAFNTPELYRPYLLDNQVSECPNLAALRRRVGEARVVVTTTSTLHSNLDLLQLKRFSLAIIDEASQILEPDLVGIFSAEKGGVAAIRKFVLIGDHKQLPAVVQQTQDESRVDEASLHAIGLRDCRSSLFERFLSRYAEDPSVTFMLTRQGRMHCEIADFVNRAYYNGRLDVVPLPHQVASLPTADKTMFPLEKLTPSLVGTNAEAINHFISSRRLAFVDVPLPTIDTSTETPNLKVNPVEAQLIAQTAYSIYRRSQETFHPLTTIGIIVPYRNQIAAVRQALYKYRVADFDQITIDTVERYQGSQRDYILYGFTVQRRFQLNFLTDNVFTDTDGTIVDRKLNVALTRAKLGMVLFGHTPLLAQAPTFRALIDYCRSHNSLIHAGGAG